MLLSVQERLVLVGVLPTECDFLTLGLVTALRGELLLNQKEHADFEVVNDGGLVRWNEEKAKDKDIEIGDALKKVIVDALDALDKAKKLTASHLTLFKKFMLPELKTVD